MEVRSLSPDEQRSVLGFVRSVLSAACLGKAEPEAPDIPLLAERGACFVTLREGGDVRGCLGSVEAFESLADNLRRNAENAAFSDPAFPPLEADELDFVTLEVSILSPIRKLHSPDELAIGLDGALLVYRGRRALFLPHVAAEQRWSTTELWENLACKTGAGAEAWRLPEAELYSFRCESFSE